jgi:chloramphenicol 3-O-phosphotransferase
MSNRYPNGKPASDYRVVWIYGPPASGKLTIARELSTLTQLPVFHNHLAVDLANALFPFGSDQFVRLREYSWIEAFRNASLERRSFIFTFAPERTVRPSFVSHASMLVERLDGRVLWVRLDCADEVIEARLGNEDRSRWGKLGNVAQYRRLKEEGALRYRPLPADLTLDSAAIAPKDAAQRIKRLLDESR